MVQIQRHKVLLLLTFVGIVLILVSAFSFLRLDFIVHHTLYEFGLRFSSEWAEQYGVYYKLVLGLLGLSTLTSCVSTAYIQVCERTQITFKRWVVGSLLLIGSLSALGSAFFFTQLNLIVHGGLYAYGLQFSYAWANQYWLYAGLALDLTGLVAIVDVGSIAYALATPPPIKITLQKSITGLLLASGIISLLLSVVFESSIAAFIGLGLVFWGSIMLYVRSHKYVQERVLSATLLPSFMNIDQAMENLGYQGPAIYLPPKYLRDIDSSKVYIGTKSELRLPSLGQTLQHEGLFQKDHDGVLLTPAGAELALLFEEILGTRFMETDLRFLVLNVPTVIIEDLEIAQNVEFSTDNDRVQMKATGLSFEDLYVTGGKFPFAVKTLGHPITSAIACALAKATGKFIVMERDILSKDGQTVEAEYILLEGSSG